MTTKNELIDELADALLEEFRLDYDDDEKKDSIAECADEYGMPWSCGVVDAMVSEIEDFINRTDWREVMRKRGLCS